MRRGAQPNRWDGHPSPLHQPSAIEGSKPRRRRTRRVGERRSRRRRLWAPRVSISSIRSTRREFVAVEIGLLARVRLCVEALFSRTVDCVPALRNFGVRRMRDGKHGIRHRSSAASFARTLSQSKARSRAEAAAASASAFSMASSSSSSAVAAAAARRSGGRRTNRRHGCGSPYTPQSSRRSAIRCAAGLRLWFRHSCSRGSERRRVVRVFQSERTGQPPKRTRHGSSGDLAHRSTRRQLARRVSTRTERHTCPTSH